MSRTSSGAAGDHLLRKQLTNLALREASPGADGNVSGDLRTRARVESHGRVPREGNTGGTDGQVPREQEGTVTRTNPLLEKHT